MVMENENQYVKIVRECLVELSKREIDPAFGPAVDRILGMDDWHVIAALSTGVPAGSRQSGIILKFYPGVGFRCTNDISRVGSLPSCRVAERILNEGYKNRIRDLRRVG